MSGIRSVFVTSYDWSDYGHGVDGLFGTFAEALAFSEEDSTFTRQVVVEEISEDFWMLHDMAGNYRYITRFTVDPDVLFARGGADDVP